MDQQGFVVRAGVNVTSCLTTHLTMSSASVASSAALADCDRDTAITRSLLGYGMLVGPLYLIVGLAQAFLRDGFDFSKHALSHLANGPGGWVQTANFVVCGAMVIAAAVGYRRAAGRTARIAAAFLGAFGASMLVAAACPADPVYGFPPGTTMTDPTSISTRGLVHFIAGALGFTSFGISALLSARVMSRARQSGLSRISLLAGLAILIGFFGGGAFSSSAGGIAGIWFSVVVGWCWLAVISRHLYRHPVA